MFKIKAPQFQVPRTGRKTSRDIRCALVGIVLLFPLSVGVSLAASSDEWYHRPLDLTYRSYKSPLGPERFTIVSEDAQRRAQGVLASERFVELSQDNLAKYCDARFVRANQGQRVFLVRGVYEDTDGVFHVYLDGLNLLVTNFSLGREKPIKRKVLAVALDFVPSEVYSFTSGAQ
jgi:hypothetical protein